MGSEGKIIFGLILTIVGILGGIWGVETGDEVAPFAGFVVGVCGFILLSVGWTTRK